MTSQAQRNLVRRAPIAAQAFRKGTQTDFVYVHLSQDEAAGEFCRLVFAGFQEVGLVALTKLGVEYEPNEPQFEEARALVIQDFKLALGMAGHSGLGSA
jgi:hypothetical protein